MDVSCKHLIKRSIELNEKVDLYKKESEEFYHVLLQKWATDFNAVPSLDSVLHNKKSPLLTEESRERIRPILAAIESRVRRDDDWRDLSRHPSYTTVDQPYRFKCRDRYNRIKRKYEVQFQREMRLLIHHTPSAYEQMNLYCNMTYTSLWPPLHNYREIDYTKRHIFTLGRKERDRVRYLMKNKIY